MKEFHSHLESFEVWLKSNIPFVNDSGDPLETSPELSLGRSMGYSFFGGGKRFRPLLSVLVHRLFQDNDKAVYPYAAALEMIHTYSLIHDDLPCMDNDDIRRGQPTNHKVFGEDIALLAGDALISEAFLMISKSYASSPKLALQLINLLGKSIGPQGMVMGQVLDLKSIEPNSEKMKKIHQLKTGALIKASVVGGGQIAGVDSRTEQHLRAFSDLFGEAFQVADDIQDFAEKSTAGGEASIVEALGEKKAKEHLVQLSDQSVQILKEISGASSDLVQLVKFNLNRAQ